MFECGLDRGGEFGGGVAVDRDADVQFGGEVVVPQLKVEGVVDPPLSVRRQATEIDMGLEDDIEQGEINGRPGLALPGKIGEWGPSSLLAASKISRVTRGSWVGMADRTQALGGSG